MSYVVKPGIRFVRATQKRKNDPKFLVSAYVSRLVKKDLLDKIVQNLCVCFKPYIVLVPWKSYETNSVTIYNKTPAQDFTLQHIYLENNKIKILMWFHLKVLFTFILSKSLSHTVLLFFWRDSPQWGRSYSFTRFLDHTQRRTTVGRTPLDEWSAHRRDLYLTTHTTD
jgi:hypothetical protein